MQRISKPHIVDLLRIFDRRRWFVPRIRYASVRSKPELIKDLAKYFFTYERDDVLFFKLRGVTRTFQRSRTIFRIGSTCSTRFRTMYRRKVGRRSSSRFPTSR